MLPLNLELQHYYPADNNDANEQSQNNVALFSGCLSTQLDPKVVKASIKLLNRLGYGVYVPKQQVCCGALHLHDGKKQQAVKFSSNNIQIFNQQKNITTVISLVNGCTSQLKEYSQLNTSDSFIHEVKDIIDMYPEVYLGRLPCRNTFEVKIMVNKITNYESTAYGSEWFNKIVCVGGDSAPGDEYYEGEEENQAAIDYLDGFDPVKVWTSDGSFTGIDDVVSAISEGSGFLFFDGHGNPTVWSTHPPNDGETWITGLNNKDMPKLRNGEKLPIAVIGGCHNGQFNVSILNILKGILEDGLQYFSREPPLGKFWYKEWTPECWAWLMTRKIGGGSIAIMGYTGLDWFATGDYNDDEIPDCTQFYSGFANVNFFKNYGVNDLTILGQAHTQTLIDYINEYPPMDEKLDCKTVQEFALLGDPSLQIGGYP